MDIVIATETIADSMIRTDIRTITMGISGMVY